MSRLSSIDSDYEAVDRGNIRRDDILEFKDSDFTQIKKLGSGLEGDVFLAHHSGEFGEVAVKSYNKLRGDQDHSDVICLRNIPTHENVIKLIGLIRHDSCNHISGCVLEFIPLGSLDNVIYNKSFNYDNKTIFRWMKQVAKGLSHIHKYGYVHRDIKPLNLLVTRNMTIKIGDFGISRQLCSDLTLTTERGTHLYMAPEVISNEDITKRYGSEIDIYSFSITIAEMFNRELPYNHLRVTGSYQILRKVLSGMRPQLKQDIDSQVVSLLERGWAKNPDKRPKPSEFIKIAREMLNTKKQTFLMRSLNNWWNQQQPMEKIQEEEGDEDLRDILEISDIDGYLRDYFRPVRAATYENHSIKYVSNEEIELREVLFGEMPIQYKFALNMVRRRMKEGIRLYCFCFEKRKPIPFLLYKKKIALQSEEFNPLQELIQKCIQEVKKSRPVIRSISENISKRNILLVGTNDTILSGFLFNAIRCYKENRSLIAVGAENEIFEKGISSSFDYFVDDWTDGRNSIALPKRINQLTHVYNICFLIDLDLYKKMFPNFTALKKSLPPCSRSNCIAIFYKSTTKEQEALDFINHNYVQELFHQWILKKQSPELWSGDTLTEMVDFIFRHTRNIGTDVFRENLGDSLD